MTADKNVSVLTYDFIEKGVLSPYDGILGLDFFRSRHILSIDFVREKLWLHDDL